MKKLIFISFLVLSVFTLQAQSTACKIIGEISLTSVERGAFLVCMNSANPAACSIAIAANNCGKNPGCTGIVKSFTQKGCNYTVKVVDEKIQIIGKASTENLSELKRTWEALNTVQGLRWIEKSLIGF